MMTRSERFLTAVRGGQPDRVAVALTAYQAKNAAGASLIDEPVLNSVLVLVVVTSVLGPVLTERFGKRMVAAEQAATGARPPDADTAEGQEPGEK